MSRSSNSTRTSRLSRRPAGSGTVAYRRLSKNAPEKKTRGKTSVRSTKSGVGEQFLLAGLRGKGLQKRLVFRRHRSDTKSWVFMWIRVIRFTLSPPSVLFTELFFSGTDKGGHTGKWEINTRPTYASCWIPPSPQYQCSWTCASDV